MLLERIRLKFNLIDSGKASSFFILSLDVLSKSCRFRNSIKIFLKGKNENNVAPSILLVQEVYDEIL